MSRTFSQGCQRVGWVAVDTFRAMIRQRLIVAIIVAAFLLVMMGHVLRTIDFGGSPERFLVDFSFASLALFGSGVAVVGSAHVVFSDRESGAAAMVLAKAVRRAEYLVGQWVGVMVVLACLCGGAALLLLVMAALPAETVEQWGERAPVAATVAALPVIAAAFAQWLKFGVIVAGTLLIASYARSSLFTILLASTLLVVAYLRTAAQTFYREGGPAAALVRAILELVPDLQLFEVADRVTSAMSSALGVRQLAVLAAYAALYAAGYLMLAAWLSRHRDL